MLIYRLEDAKGGGIYRNPDFSTRAWSDEDYRDDRHPVPDEDALLMANGYTDFKYKFYGEFVFGFASPEQLRSWLYKQSWRDKLHALGVRVNLYEVPDYRACVGDTQAVFVRDAATLLSTHSINEV